MKTSFLVNFFFKEVHPEINSKLFKYQSDLASFAVEITRTAFFGKSSDGIRPFINQQMKPKGDPYGKPVRNHYETYKSITLERIKFFNKDISKEAIESIMIKFNKAFEEHCNSVVTPKQIDVKKFEYISSDMLFELSVAARALGGQLSYEDFFSCMENLSKNNKKK